VTLEEKIEPRRTRRTRRKEKIVWMDIGRRYFIKRAALAADMVFSLLFVFFVFFVFFVVQSLEAACCASHS